MNYRKLGETDLIVSEISIGCSGFWGNSLFSEKKAEKIIRIAFERGINFFDTGHNYCNFNAEPRLGRIIKKILSNNDRSGIIISTKAGTTIPNTRLLGPRKHVDKNFSPDYIENTCERSIGNLNCQYLDIFQLHGITTEQINNRLIDRLFLMKEKGMFRYLGVNTHSERVMHYIAENPNLFDMVLIDYNILQLDREVIIDKLFDAGIGIVAGTILAQGHLIQGKIGTFKSFADVWYMVRAKVKPSSRILARNAKIMQRTLLNQPDITAAQAAFSYILENKKVSSCVFGTTKVPNLLDVLAAKEKKLSAECKESIKKSFDELKVKISA